MGQDIQRKNEALKSFESEIEKLQCSLICEKEQSATLGMEQTNMATQLQKAREQKRGLEAELESCIGECRAKVKLRLPLQMK
jgi:septal ring factor EnvC (AmiA/AmiB activator)